MCHRHPSASGQLCRLADNPRASASGLISRGPLSVSVRAERLLRPAIAATAFGAPENSFRITTGSLVAVVWGIICISARTSLPVIVCSATEVPSSNWNVKLCIRENNVKRLYGGALSCIDGSGWAIETVWLLWLRVIIISSMIDWRTVSVQQAKEMVSDCLYPETSVSSVCYCQHIMYRKSDLFVGLH